MKRRSTLVAVLSVALLSACSSKNDHPPPVPALDAGDLSDASTIDAPTETMAPTSCSDGSMNNDETDVDCGGKTCKPCDTAGKCKLPADCASGVCSATGVCAAAKCDDKVKNGTETDVDCGNAPCPLCADAKACSNETNCASGVCTAGKCAPASCTDGVLNHGESDIDCGGPCAPCGVGKKCGGVADCISNRCGTEGTTTRCQCPDDMARIQLTGAGGGAYCVDKEEVSNNDYATFLSTGPDTASQPAYCLWNDNFAPTSAWPSDVKDQLLPVRYVDWCDAYTYCKKQNRRLCGKVGGGTNPPTESDKATDQWFNACSQGGSNVYPYPDLGSGYDAKRCNGSGFWGTGSTPTALLRNDPGIANCIGGPMGAIKQLSGNVKEWEDSCDASVGKTDNCLARGGSFRSSPDELKCVGKQSLPRETHSDEVGFRCCL